VWRSPFRFYSVHKLWSGVFLHSLGGNVLNLRCGVYFFRKRNCGEILGRCFWARIGVWSLWVVGGVCGAQNWSRRFREFFLCLFISMKLFLHKTWFFTSSLTAIPLTQLPSSILEFVRLPKREVNLTSFTRLDNSAAIPKLLNLCLSGAEKTVTQILRRSNLKLPTLSSRVSRIKPQEFFEPPFWSPELPSQEKSYSHIICPTQTLHFLLSLL
jgi:hypothetical protein